MQPLETVFSEVASFYNTYTDLRSVQLGQGSVRSEPVDYIYIPITAGNRTEAKTWGVEVEADWQVRRSWRLRAAYTLLKLDVDAPLGSAAEGESPEHQLFLGSALEVSQKLTLDSGLSYTSELAARRVEFRPQFVNTLPAKSERSFYMSLRWSPQ